MKDFFKKLNHLSLKKDGKFLGFSTSPEADWKIVVYTTTLLVLLVFIFNLYIFIKIDKGEIFMIERSVESDQTLNMRKLESVTEYYLDQQIKYDTVKGSRVSVPDPSI